HGQITIYPVCRAPAAGVDARFHAPASASPGAPSSPADDAAARRHAPPAARLAAPADVSHGAPPAPAGAEPRCRCSPARGAPPDRRGARPPADAAARALPVVVARVLLVAAEQPQPARRRLVPPGAGRPARAEQRPLAPRVLTPPAQAGARGAR